jgi:putative membrane protein
MEREPDYRFTLANERTALAWLRTSLALMAAAVAVVQFAPRFGGSGARSATATCMGTLSVVVAVAAVLRWRSVQRAMRREEPLPRSPMVWILGMSLGAVGVGVCLVVLLGP